MRTKLFLSVIYIFSLLFIYGFDNHKDSKTKNEAIAKSFIESWTKHDINGLVSLFAEDGLYEEVCSGRNYSSKEDIAQYAELTLTGIPDSEFEIIALVADSKTAMVEWVWKGTNSVGWDFMGIPATGKYFELRGVSVMIIENNLIKRNSDYWDWNSLMTKIGAN